MAVGYVRAARADEAEEIARIQLATWRTAYRRLFPARVLDRLDPTWMAGRWREAIEAPPDARHRVLIAIEQAEQSQPAAPGNGGADAAALVGFAASGPAGQDAAAPEEAAPPSDTAAITDLLVEPRWGRRGHGSRLLAASVALWRGDGFTTAVAWVFEEDPATRSFLRSAGWEPDGARRALDVEDLLVPQLRMHTALSEP